MAGPAAAHISPDKDEVAAGAFTSVTLTVPHGCEESPTKQLTIQVPEQLNDVGPQVHPGWTIEVTKEDLAEPIDDGEGGEITERAKEVVFTAERGNELPHDFRDNFTLGFQAPDAEGETLYWKVIQTGTEGETPWIEEWDGEGEEPESPAPSIMVTEAAPEGGHGEETTDTTEAEDDDEEATDTTEAAADDSSSSDDDGNGLAIAGVVLGGLGLVTGGIALSRSRGTT
jgi:uncharacterized protein YcnI